MTDRADDQLALNVLSMAALNGLGEEFARLSQLPTAWTAAQWARGWMQRLCAEADSRMAAPGPEAAEAPPVAMLDDGELIVLRDHFGGHQLACSHVPGVALWCRALVAAMVDELDDRLYDAAWWHAQSLMIDAEESRRAREGKPPPDLRGLPTWSDISSPRDDA